MSKNLDFTRPSKESSILKFENSSATCTWPPVEGMRPIVKNALADLVEAEIKGIFTPQLKAMNATLGSPGIIQILMQITQVQEVTGNTARDYYVNVSDAIFTAIEESLPDLLGQEDTCGWFI